MIVVIAWQIDYPCLQAHQLMVDLGVSPDNIFTADLSGQDHAAAAALKGALQGCEALVICTSAVPQPRVLPTVLGAMGHWVRQRLRGREADDPFVPVATWKGGQTPQQVLLPLLACRAFHTCSSSNCCAAGGHQRIAQLLTSLVHNDHQVLAGLQRCRTQSSLSVLTTLLQAGCLVSSTLLVLVSQLIMLYGQHELWCL